MNAIQKSATAFMCMALAMLLLSLIFGTLAAHSYTSPGIWKKTLGFIQLRPLHVSAALFWILLGATGGLIYASTKIEGMKLSLVLLNIQIALWILSLIGIFYSYFNGQFGGREYLEFPPIYALPIAVSWLLFAFNFIRAALRIKDWPVYFWMWMTGLIFFIITFGEAYLWEFPYFRQYVVKDMMIQWKSTGAMVGSWNQLIYGLGFFLMDRIGGDRKFTRSGLAFAMYFLGLFNLMFNWSHHIYTLPTAPYVRYIGYIVSMTEWLLFIRIIYNWKKTVTEAERHAHLLPYRFLLAADIWVFLNLGLALLMSIPAINLYTHGTHITVAHAMGTTVGINSMILLAVCLEFIRLPFSGSINKWFNICFWITQVTLLIFWVDLIVIGMLKGKWQLMETQIRFQELMNNLHGWFRLFNYAGGILMFSLGCIAWLLFTACFYKWKASPSSN